MFVTRAGLLLYGDFQNQVKGEKSPRLPNVDCSVAPQSVVAMGDDFTRPSPALVLQAQLGWEGLGTRIGSRTIRYEELPAPCYFAGQASHFTSTDK